MSKTQTYPSDLPDAQWGLIRPLLPQPQKRGRRRRLDYRHVLDAIFYSYGDLSELVVFSECRSPYCCDLLNS